MRTPSRLLLPALLLPILACGYPNDGPDQDPVSGTWKGSWYRAGQIFPAGKLRVRLSPVDDETWRAVLEISNSIESTYEWDVVGRRDGSRVLFEDEVDFGRASGGVYEWWGEVNGDFFQGSYRHPSGDGRFDLTRVEKPASILPPDS